MAKTIQWKHVKLGEVAEFRNGVNYNRESFGTGVKVVGVKDFQDYSKPKYDSLEEINPEGVVTSKSILRDGDIVFVRSNGNRELIGRSLFIDRPTEEVTHSAFTIRVRFNAPEFYPKFYSYFFRTSAIRKGLTAHGGGTNISNLNQDILSGLEIPVPDLPTQRKIASILSAYDDLIENNLHRIKILEEMAQSLYREWFVHFRFPGHESADFIESELGPIPRGWEIKKLGELADQMRRGVPKGQLDGAGRYVGLEHIPRKSLALDAWEEIAELGSNKLTFERGEVLFGKIRPYFHKVSVAPFDGICSADTIVIRSKKPENRALVTACVFTDAFVAHAAATSNGSKMPRTDWKVLKNYPLILPPKDLLARFSALFENAVEQQQNLVSRNQTLRRTRDLLLPQLLAGQQDPAQTA